MNKYPLLHSIPLTAVGLWCRLTVLAHGVNLISADQSQNHPAQADSCRRWPTVSADMIQHHLTNVGCQCWPMFPGSWHWRPTCDGLCFGPSCTHVSSHCLLTGHTGQHWWPTEIYIRPIIWLDSFTISQLPKLSAVTVLICDWLIEVLVRLLGLPAVFVFTTQCCASAVYAVIVCLSVCLPQAGIVLQYNTKQYKICKAPCCRGFRGAGEQVS